MYTGTMIEDLIESVQRAELQAERERSLTRYFEQQNFSAHMRLHAVHQDLSYERGRVGVA